MDKKQFVCGVVVSLAVLVLNVGGPARAQVTQALTFVRPAVQGPGTQGYGVISDPTIQPFVAPGVPARLNLSTLVDLRGSGQPDIFGCHGSAPPFPPGEGPCRVLRPQPDGSVIDITRQLFGPGPLPSVMWGREIVSGDFNRDGRPDIFVGDYGYDGPPWPGHTNVLLLSNADGTYVDRSSTLPQVPDFVHSACVGDINGDGYLDIYVGNVDRPPAPYFLMGRGDGTFTQKTAGLPASILQGERYLSSLLVDLDQDGHDDLVLGSVASSFGHNIVLLNDGTGDFTTRPRVLLPQGPLPANDFFTGDIAAFDVNQDGRSDLMLLSSVEHADVGFGLQVLINQGGGVFLDETAIRLPGTAARLTGPWYPFIRYADFNGDGWQDFYLDTVQHEDGSIHPRVWLNNGNNSWAPVAPAALPAVFGRQSIFAVDFDGDGRADILHIGGEVPDPDIGYQSFLNRTLAPPRTLTSATSGPVVALSWQASVGATSYRLEAGSAPGLSNLFAGDVGPAPAFSAAPPVGTYYVRVRAADAHGTSGPSNEVVVLAAGCTPPETPLGIASSVAATQVSLSWSAAVGASSYTVQVGRLPGAADVFDGNVGATTAVSGNLPSGLYFFRAFGVNACGQGPASATVDATVVCASLSPPAGFSATASGSTVTMQWLAVPSATSYVLEAGIAPSVSNLFVGTVGPGTALVAPAVPPGSYRVRVRAGSACGVSAPSATVTLLVP